MASLLITTRWPDPLSLFTHGTAVRVRLMMRALMSVDPELDLMILARPNNAADANAASRIADDMARLWGIRPRQVVVVPWGVSGRSASSLLHGHLLPALSMHLHPDYSVLSEAAVLDAVRNHVRRAGIQRILAHRIEAICPLLRCGTGLPPVYFDLDDVEHTAFERSLDLPPHYRAKRLLRLQLPALRRLERQAAALARATFVCSERDRAHLSLILRNDRIYSIPNAVQLAPALPLPEVKRVLFIGIHSYPPNRTAAEQLMHEIWPLVRQRHPDAVLSIAGRFIERVRGHDSPPPGVEMLGFVDSLDDLYANTRIVACPILSGSGTRIKIIEAAMYGRPVVSTALGAEGLDFRADRNEIVIADGVAPFAEALCLLLDDPAWMKAVAEAGRRMAVDTYDASRIIDSVVRLMAPT